MKSTIRKPRKVKVAGFMRAQSLINEKNYDVRKAVKEAGISQTTYYKYLEMFGDVKGNLLEVYPKQQPSQVIAQPKKSGNEKTGAAQRSEHTDLERILQENAALEKQVQLRIELSKMMH